MQQFLEVIWNPTSCCFKIRKYIDTNLRVDPNQARGASSINTMPFEEFNPGNNTSLLLPSGKKPDTATIISRHTSPRIRPEWITQNCNFLRSYSSYHKCTDESYKKSKQAYEDIFLTDNDPAHYPPSIRGPEKLNIGKLVKRRLPKPCRR